MSAHIPDDTLFEYLDGILPPAGTAALEGHLSRCVACSQNLARLRRLFAGIESLPQFPLSRDLAPAVLARLRARQPLPRAVGVLGVLQFLAGLAVLAVSAPFTRPYFAALFNRFRAALPDLSHVSRAFWEIPARLASGMEDTFAQVAALPASLDNALNLLPVLLPVLLATGLLWLVGSGILIRHAHATPKYP
jgi:anti-sigma factor RsiW